MPKYRNPKETTNVKPNIILKIAMLCIICAATLICGCIDPETVNTKTELYGYSEPVTVFTQRLIPMPAEINRPPGSPDPKTIEDVIPHDYYSCAPGVIDGDVYEFMENWVWDDDHQHEEDGFDCSQMSLYMEYVLENSGYHTKICIDEYHMWIMVDVGGEDIAYECTGCYWVHDTEPVGGVEYYSPDVVFMQIEDVLEDSLKYPNGIKGFKDENVFWMN